MHNVHEWGKRHLHSFPRLLTNGFKMCTKRGKKESLFLFLLLLFGGADNWRKK